MKHASNNIYTLGIEDMRFIFGKKMLMFSLEQDDIICFFLSI